MTRWLNYSEAAKRVGRSVRNVRRWHAEGMTMTWRTSSDGQRERVVDEDVLLAWWRDRMKASPVHYYRLRAATRANGLPDPARPAPPGARSEPHASAEPAPQPYPVFEPLDTMKPMRGGPEYRALQEALQDDEPGCGGIDAFTADHIDPDEAPVLAAICAACPVRDLRAAFVRLHRPTVGFWAGAPSGTPQISADSAACLMDRLG